MELCYCPTRNESQWVACWDPPQKRPADLRKTTPKVVDFLSTHSQCQVSNAPPEEGITCTRCRAVLETISVLFGRRTQRKRAEEKLQFNRRRLQSSVLANVVGANGGVHPGLGHSRSCIQLERTTAGARNSFHDIRLSVHDHMNLASSCMTIRWANREVWPGVCEPSVG